VKTGGRQSWFDLDKKRQGEQEEAITLKKGQGGKGGESNFEKERRTFLLTQGKRGTGEKASLVITRKKKINREKDKLRKGTGGKI